VQPRPEEIARESFEARTASAADLPLLLGFVRDFWAHEGIAYEEAAVVRALGELLANPALGRVFLLEVDGTVAGYAVLGFGFSLEYRGRDAFLDELFLVPVFRGRGLGEHALDVLEATCRRLGIRALHLEVNRSNLRAQALYRRRGFSGEDRLLLTKWLDPDVRSL
jgi:ribosomal protein S18 acetylase RimI-like enzyme